MVWIQTLIDTSYGKSWPASSVGGNFHGDKYSKKKRREIHNLKRMDIEKTS